MTSPRKFIIALANNYHRNNFNIKTIPMLMQLFVELEKLSLRLGRFSSIEFIPSASIAADGLK